MGIAACNVGPINSTCYQSRKSAVDCAERPVIIGSNFRYVINVFLFIGLNIRRLGGRPGSKELLPGAVSSRDLWLRSHVSETGVNLY
jgi:hypothetical protein